MGWADRYVEQLAAGRTIEFRPRGSSMEPIVPNGALVTVRPMDWHVAGQLSASDELFPGDVVLCKVRGSQYLHLVKGLVEGRVLIGNNRGGTNGWTPFRNVYGKVTEVKR